VKQKFEVVVDNIEQSIPWTEEQFKATIENNLWENETVTVREIKDTTP
jgi:hypothetical protein